MSCPTPAESPLVDRFLQAMRNDDASQVETLLTDNPSLKEKINAPIGPFDSPPIVNVRSRGMLDVLLAAGADINAKSRWWAGGFGLLDSASPELSAYAIERGATLTAHAAARLGMVDRLREMLAGDAKLVHARGGDGQLPLHFARTVEVAELLLQHGADINARDIDHESTAVQWMADERHVVARHLIAKGCEADLLLASAVGDADLANRLLEANPACIGISVNDKHFPKKNPHAGGTIYQWTLGFHATPHTTARKFGHEKLLPLLFAHSPPGVKLVNACWLGDEKLARETLAETPDLSSQLSTEQQQQLAHAARNNQPQATRLMLECGFPVDARGQHQGTALHWAAFHGNAALVKAILPFGPNLELLDADYRVTPLGWAIYGSQNSWNTAAGDYAGTVEALLQAGAQPPTKPGGTPVVQEVLRKHLQA